MDDDVMDVVDVDLFCGVAWSCCGCGRICCVGGEGWWARPLEWGLTVAVRRRCLHSLIVRNRRSLMSYSEAMSVFTWWAGFNVNRGYGVGAGLSVLG